ncbi:MAG: OmpH family outer membrane protein [Vicinamibacterales bacterium]
MRALKMLIVVAAMTFMLAGGPVWAQTPPAQPPAQNPPAEQQKPGATSPAAQPAAQPQPPRPFPEGAKVAFVNINAIAAGSSEGKAATAKIQEFLKKKNAEIQERQKSLQTLQTKLQQGVSVMSDQARSQLEKDITKQSRELQSAQEDAQQEQQQLTQDLQNEFQQKLFPIVDAIAKEKGLHMVFSIADSGILWPDPGLDLTNEVIKRFDAATKPGTTKK